MVWFILSSKRLSGILWQSIGNNINNNNSNDNNNSDDNDDNNDNISNCSGNINNNGNDNDDNRYCIMFQRESRFSGKLKLLKLSPHSIEKQLSVEEQITKEAKR